VATREIRTSDAIAACDVCGRTLLRGERAEVYLSGGTRRSVCELCTSRAVHEGWIREGTVPTYDDGDAGGDRRRSLLNRLRARRDAGRAERPGLADDLDGAAATRSSSGQARSPRPPGARGAGARERVREPRHVRAVPTNAEHKVASAVEVFNSSEHRRTIAGVARSLGLPEISVLPSTTSASVVHVVASWELCWYRYEIDLSDEIPTVRVGGQGYELDELAPEERKPNATADDHGSLTLA
jgi:hypothetical protein